MKNTVVNRSYSYQKCEKSHLQGITELINDVFTIHSNIEYWEWKYFNNPFKENCSTVILFKDSVVGLTGLMPVKFQVKGNELIGLQEFDTAIHKEHRRLDVFLTMINKTRDSILSSKGLFLYGFTNYFSSTMNRTILGKKRIGNIPRMVKVLNAEQYLSKKISNKVLLEIVSAVGNAYLCLKDAKKTTLPDEVQIGKVERFDERFDVFWDKIKNDYPIMIGRSSSYLDWRYIQSKHNNYDVYCVEDVQTGTIRGFVVLGDKQADGLLRGRIMEIMTPRDEAPNIARHLIKFAVTYFRKRRADTIDCWMFSHCHIYSELVKEGFSPREKKDQDCYFQNVNLDNSPFSEEFFTNKANWYLSIGDSDLG